MRRNCNRKLARGLLETVYLTTLEELDGSTPDVSNPLLLSAIAMKTGKKLSAYEGREYSNQAQLSSSRNDYGTSITQTHRVIIFDDSADADKEVQAILSRTDLVVFSKKRGKGGKWKIYGMNAGLTASLASDSNDNDLKGAYVIELTSADEEMPYTLVHVTSSLEDTDTYLAGLAKADA